MKTLIDTNVVLDVLINNAVFFANSKKIFDFASGSIPAVTSEQFIKIITSGQ